MAGTTSSTTTTPRPSASSLAIKPNAKLALYQNYLVGDEWSSDVDDGGTRNLFDTVLSYAATDKLTLLGNFDYGRDELDGETVDW